MAKQVHIPINSTSARRKKSIWILEMLAVILTSLLFVAILIRWLRKRLVRPAIPLLEIEIPMEVEAPPVTVAPPVVEAPVLVEAPPVVEAPPFEAPPDVVFALPIEEAVVFEIPVAEEAPDIYFTVPPDVLVEASEPLILSDGRKVLFQFNWQNPNLRQKIYPFRNQKLRDFLLYYSEIDLVKQYAGKAETDPVVKEMVNRARLAIQDRRSQVMTQLEAAIAVKKTAELKTFGSISEAGSTHKQLRFKQTYYIDQQIQRAQDKLDDLEDRKASLLKRVDWYEEEADPRKQMWRTRAAEGDADIAATQKSLAELRALRELFTQEAELPAAEVKKNDALRWQIRQLRERWKEVDQPNLTEQRQEQLQQQLLLEVIHWFNKESDRFPEWLVYMVIHFSGMRYMSAHSSWADPRFLLELLTREELEDEVKQLQKDEVRLAAECDTAAIKIQQATAFLKPVDPRRKENQRLIDRLKSIPQRGRALIEVRSAAAVDEIQALPDENACLNRLSQFKAERDGTPDAVPPWVWAEVVKFTPLRLGTEDPNWEAYSPERNQWQNNRWREVLSTWQGKDVTAWRAKHYQTLDLIVTRAVCNEIAEHIQDLRGLTPYAGLTSRPTWYLRAQYKDTSQCYLKQAPAESDFRRGASILWLEWMEQQPTAWQVAHPLPGDYVMAPVQKKATPGKKGEVSRKLLEQQEEQSGEWDYQARDNAFIRTQKLPTREELKKQGKTDKEIGAILAARKTGGEFQVEYLRWRHEATVVDVVEMIDGKYVLTFETGKIGLILRRMSDLAGNPLVFAGYIPAKPLPPEKDARLVKMLSWERILPQVTLPQRKRPKWLEEPKVPPLPPPAAITTPQIPYLVIREVIRCYVIAGRDKFGQPKMEPANPVVQLKQQAKFKASATHKESQNDTGNGIINTMNGDFVKVSEYTPDPRAIGKFIRLDEITDLRGGRWVTVNPLRAKSNLQRIKGYDRAGKPWLDPLPPNVRIHILPGQKVRVSTTHIESFKDSGDGVIWASGLVAHLLVLECPDVQGCESWFIINEEFISTTPP